MSVLSELEWEQIASHYSTRIRIHEKLLTLHKQGDKKTFCELALGISDQRGNYSAAEHGLGPRIWSENINIVNRVWELAEKFMNLNNARTVPDLIREQNLRFLRVAVGSEISCLVNPQVCWVANTRTLWTHLVIKHNDNLGKANEELALYRDSESESEMDYAKWAALHAELNPTMTRIRGRWRAVGEEGRSKTRQHQIFMG